MILSKNVTDQIVLELSEIVEQHLNIIDIDGVILSSTDKLRVGSIHGGSLKIIQDKLPELMITSDDEFPGAKNGINLPIEVNGNIIGVIGITGSREQVYKYGQIIKKVTEILLLESNIREKHLIEQKARDRFLEEWIFGRYERHYPNEFEERAQRLGVDVKTPKRVIVFSVRSEEGLFLDDQKQTKVSHHVRTFLKTLNQAFLFRTSTLFIAVLNFVEDDELLDIANEIDSIVRKNFTDKIYIGLNHDEKTSVQEAFKNANAAHQLSLKTSNRINIYDPINIDLYITRMPLKDREEFVFKLFKGVEFLEIGQHLSLLSAYYEENGSIEKTSEKLFIHKNTLQYRLQKIVQLTDKDPRKLKDSYIFMAAIRIYNSILQQR